MPLIFKAIPTKDARNAQNDKPDANGQIPERVISDGEGNPCRHCLTEIPKGAPMLILGYRPFPTLQPYAEVGPIFLCANKCERHEETGTLPKLFWNSKQMLIRGYSKDDRIVYGSGAVVKISDLVDAIKSGFTNPKIKYFHMRSASNNCFQAKVSNRAI